MWLSRIRHIILLISILHTCTAQNDCVRSDQQDIVVVLDSSTSISRPDFKKQLEFVNSLIEKIAIGPNDNQVGVVSFSDNYRLNFHLNANSNETPREKSKLKEAVSRIRQIGGGTNTHRPLQFVRRSMFTASRGDRLNKKNVCVVITDGKSYEPDETGSAAQQLRGEGVDMFALGVGGGVDESELLAIAGDKSRVFKAISYDELDIIIEAFATSVLGACQNDAPGAPVITGTPENPVDLGTNIELKCSSETQSNDASLSWFRDNQEIPRTNYKIEGNFVVSYLRFNAETNDGETVFECLLRHPLLNSSGLRDQTTFDVMIVPGMPQITYNPSSSVLDGTQVSLTCRSDTQDVAKTEVVWIKSRNRVNGVINKDEYSISNVIVFPASLVDNRERYACHVLHPNLPEPFIRYADLTVSALPGAPMISADPAGPVRSGSRVTLTCVSEGTDSNTELVWLRNGSVIDADYYISGRVVRNDLTVTATSSQDYVCRVRHPALTNALTAEHSLKTYAPPQPPRIASIGAVRSLETQVNLICTVQPADALTSLVWIRNDRVIDSSFVMSGSTMTNEYSLRAADVEGIHCEARHVLLEEPLRVDPPQIVIRNIILPGAPVINNNDRIRSHYVGERAELICRSAGNDVNTDVVWYRSGSETPIDNTHYTEDGYVVNSMSVEVFDDDVTYECRVSHPDLTQSLAATTQIPIAEFPSGPQITIRPKSALVAGSVFETSCRSSTYDPDVKLYWYVDGKRVGGDYRREGQYVVNDIRYTVEGGEGLECRADISKINYNKSDYVTLNTIELSVPRVSQEPQRAQHGGSVKLFCSAEHYDQPNHKLEWYRRGQLIDDTSYNTNQLIINELEVSEINPDLLEYTCTLRYQNKKASTVYTILVDLDVVDIEQETILGTDQNSQAVKLTCRTKHLNLQGITLDWYQLDKVIDFSYYFSGEYIINQLEVKMNPAVNTLTCRAVYGVKTSEETITLQIVEIGSPVVRQDPVLAKVGERVRLVCEVPHDNVDNLRLTWVDGSGVRDDSSYRSGSLLVNELDLTVNPEILDYSCILAYGTRTRTTPYRIAYVVTEFPGSTAPPSESIESPEIEQLPPTARLGESIVLMCKVRNANVPSQRLVWYRDGVRMESDSSTTENYVQSEIYINDRFDSDYSCQHEINDKTISVPHKPAFVTQVPSPEITNVPTNPVESGSDVSMMCVWRSSAPQSRLVWLNAFTGETIDNSFDLTTSSMSNEVTVKADRKIIYECRVAGLPEPPLARVKIPVVAIIDPRPECAGAAANIDVVIILDSSTTIGRPDFARQLEFVQRFVDAFTIGPDDVQVGIVSFSDGQKINFHMNEYLEKQALSEAIGAIKQIGGNTNTHLPIQTAREVMFKPERGDRPTVLNLCIVLTDGESNQPKLTANQSELAREAGIKMYAIGVGSNVEFDELKAIAGDIDQVYYAEDFQALKNIENEFVSAARRVSGNCGLVWSEWGDCSSTCGYGIRIRSRGNDTETVNCNQSPCEVWSEWGDCSTTCGYGIRLRSRGNDAETVDCNQSPCEEWSTWSSCSRTCGPGKKFRIRGDEDQVDSCIDRICENGCMTVIDQADIAFLLDTSNSVYEPDFETMKLFLTDFIDLFNISSDKQRVAALTFSDDVEVNFHLNDFYSNSELKRALLGVKMHLGGTNTNKAIEFMRTDLFDENHGARINSPKIGFVITDGRSHEPAATAVQAELARQFGVILYSIGIGPATDRSELINIAGNESRVYEVDSYDDIRILKQRIGMDLSACYDPNEPVDGSYSVWSSWTACSATCGYGQASRTRVCSNPAPRNGGRECAGEPREIKSCRAGYCEGESNTIYPPVENHWSEWEFSTPCSATCGQGVQEVVRFCISDTECNRDEVQKKVIQCQIKSCDGDRCGGSGGLSVMFAAHNINSQGPNSYYTVELIKNISAQLPIDGQTVRTSLTLTDCASCSCSRNTGYDVYKYKDFDDIMNHLNKIDLRDTHSLLQKVRADHRLKADTRNGFNTAKQTLVLFIDRNDIITPKTIDEINKIQLAGVEVYVIAMDVSETRPAVRSLASTGKFYNYWSDSLAELYRELCA